MAEEMKLFTLITKLMKQKEKARTGKNWRLYAKKSHHIGTLFLEVGEYDEATKEFENEVNAYERVKSKKNDCRYLTVP